MQRLIVTLWLLLGVGHLAWAAPDTTMTIAPSANSGASITASDINARSNAVSSAYNSHSHTDISQVASTLNIGVSSGGTSIASAGTIVLEGATADDNEATISVTDPTADRTITVPNSTGTLIVSGHTFTGDVTATLDTDGSTALASAGVKSTNITFSRTDAQGSGSAAYTGMGFQPTAVLLFCTDDNASDEGTSWGFIDDASGDAVLLHDAAADYETATTKSVHIEDVSSAGNRFTFQATSLDSDGLTGTWTETSTGPDTTCVAIGLR